MATASTESLERASYPSGHLFIELEEKHGSSWKETSRWNHALTEDVQPGSSTWSKPTWSRPHLPTVSVPSLWSLRQALGLEAAVLLDPPGDTLPSTDFKCRDGASLPRYCINGLALRYNPRTPDSEAAAVGEF